LVRLNIKPLEEHMSPFFPLRILLVSFIVSVSAFAADLRFVPGSDPAIVWNGRVDRSDPGRIVYTWPGVHCRFLTDSPVLKVVLDDNANITRILVDGQQILEIIPAAGIRTNLIPLPAGTGQVREITIIKRTECPWAEGSFLGVLVDSSASFAAPVSRGRRIEFIGDSFTAGYGNLGTSLSCPGRGVWTNTDAWQSWAAVVSRNFNADFLINASSGKGLVLNYGQSLPGTPDQAMPSEYTRTLQDKPDKKWAFTEQKPDLVVIFIGLNDFSTPWDDKNIQPEDPTVDQWTAEYLKIIKTLRKKYPGVKFLCMGFPAHGIDRFVKEMVNKQKKKGAKDIAYGLMPSLSQPDLGCDWHPSVSGDRKMADAVIPVVGELMGWTAP
jgi:lysophospholipase L1-like esterase